MPNGRHAFAVAAASRFLESVFELTGESMSPTIERGGKVLVEPLDGPLVSGEVILIEGGAGNVIHRYLGSVSWGAPCREYVVHAGDSSAIAGIVLASQVRGRVRTVLHPASRHLIPVADPPPAVRRRHRRFLARWQTYARLRRAVEAIPGVRRFLPRGADPDRSQDPAVRSLARLSRSQCSINE